MYLLFISWENKFKISTGSDVNLLLEKTFEMFHYFFLHDQDSLYI